MRKLIVIYLLVMNIIGFIMMGADKKRAVKNEWRIPERRLLLCALFGGSIGSLVGMFHFRHKTKHPKFFIGIPVMLIFQIEMIVLYLVCVYKLK